jgi:hypothetical protein
VPNHYKERWEGPIRGIRLPLAAWNSLHNEGITTIDQLTAAADRLEPIPGIGLNMAQVIREELACVSAVEQPDKNADHRTTKKKRLSEDGALSLRIRRGK